MRIINVKGERFGKLLVLEKTDKREPKTNSVIWQCKCDCGNIIEIAWRNLKRVSHCGCERIVHHPKGSKNTYKTDGDVTYVYDNLGNFTLVDTLCLPLLRKHYWKEVNTGYWVTSKNISLHRFLTNCPKDKVVDHVNHVKNDNRLSNLRVCTHQENQINKRPKTRKYDLPTGIYETPYGKFRATIRTKEVKLFKNFDSLDEAIKQRKEWEDEYFKDFKYVL